MMFRLLATVVVGVLLYFLWDGSHTPKPQFNASIHVTQIRAHEAITTLLHHARYTQVRFESIKTH